MERSPATLFEVFLAQRQGRADRIVAIEPDPVNRAAMQERIDGWGTRAPQSMKIEPFAVGSERGILQFESAGTAGSRVGVGSSSVEVAPLDELLEGWPPTYMKFDVEGAEHDALVGGANMIRENKPVLAVCLYHRPEDLWDLLCSSNQSSPSTSCSCGGTATSDGKRCATRSPNIGSDSEHAIARSSACRRRTPRGSYREGPRFPRCSGFLRGGRRSGSQLVDGAS